MDVKFINPFIEATHHVLDTMASTKANTEKPFLKADATARGDVSAVIGLAGDVKGTISVTFTENCILPIVSRLFKEEMRELNNEIADAVGEITNMISGQARQKIQDMGTNLSAAIPTVIMGKNHTIQHITDSKVVAIPFSTDEGDFTIEVSLGD